MRSLAMTIMSVFLVLPLAPATSWGQGPYPAAAYSGVVAMDNSYCSGACGLVCDCVPPTRFTGNVDLIWLGRSQPENIGLLEAPFNAPTATFLTGNELEFDVKPGLRMSGAMELASGRTLEIEYTGIFEQDLRERRTYTDGDVDPNNDLGIVHFNGLLGSFDDVTTEYVSNLHSLEANWWECPWLGFEPVVGFRWIHHSEDLTSFATSNAAEGTLIETDNDLFGTQIGLRRVLWGSPARFRVEATLLAGIYYNDVDVWGQFSTGGATTNTVSQDFSAAAYAGELGVRAVYQLSPNLAVQVGYMGLWLDRLALAIDQMDDFDALTGAGNADFNTVIYQGGHIGLNARW